MRMRMRMLRRRRRVLLMPPVAILRVLPTLVLLTLTRLRRARGRGRAADRAAAADAAALVPVGSIRALSSLSRAPRDPLAPPPSSVAPRSSLVRRLGVPLDARRSVRASSHARAEPIRVRDVRTRTTSRRAPSPTPAPSASDVVAGAALAPHASGRSAPAGDAVRTRSSAGGIGGFLRLSAATRVLDVPRREPRVDLRRSASNLRRRPPPAPRARTGA